MLRTILAATCAIALNAPPVLADVVIPAGGSIALSSGSLDAGCTNLSVAGALNANSAAVNSARNVTIQSGGTLDGGASTITVAGDWTNNGRFNPGASTVLLTDGCGVDPATVSGNTTFNNLNITSTAGKTWEFSPGSVQTVLGALTVDGAPGQPLQLTTSGTGQPAYIDPRGQQSVTNAQTSNVVFGSYVVPPIPSLGDTALLVLALLLGATATRSLRSRRSA